MPRGVYKRKKTRRPSKPGLRYNAFTTEKFPPGYSNAKVVAVRKVKGKAQVIVVVQMEKRINL